MNADAKIEQLELLLDYAIMINIDTDYNTYADSLCQHIDMVLKLEEMLTHHKSRLSLNKWTYNRRNVLSRQSTIRNRRNKVQEKSYLFTANLDVWREIETLTKTLDMSVAYFIRETLCSF